MLMYQKQLSRRLITSATANDDYEQMIIGKLKSAHGFEYCQKLTRMMQDIHTSKDVNSDFKEYCAEKSVALPLDFSIMVLGTGAWPLEQKASGI